MSNTCGETESESNLLSNNICLEMFVFRQNLGEGIKEKNNPEIITEIF